MISSAAFMIEHALGDCGGRHMQPTVFLACTYNLWNNIRLDERRQPITRFLELRRPDILCIQELTPDLCTLVEGAVPGLRRVDDPFPGWTTESNVFWNSDLFELVEYGAEDIGMVEPDRRLFWVRLVVDSGKTLLVATAHFTWTGNKQEMKDRINIRVEQAEAAAVSLGTLVQPNEPVLFMGDFNDYQYPPQMLRDAGFSDSFSALGQETVSTYPAFPKPSHPPTVLDWMMHAGPIRPTLSSVVDFYVDRIPPSDHKPILSTYSLE
ncbi:MAG: endonuclease/exonuclease/phosphatase family protein [Rhodothermia bacterium]